MESIFQEATKLSSEGDQFVIATVVRTKGSTPQKPGAKLLVRRDGSAIGTLGGGCVEGDIWFMAKEIMRNSLGPTYQDYYLNEEIAARDGLVCGGTMYFYIEPFRRPKEFLNVGDKILDAYQGGDSITIATVIRSQNPDRMGSRLLIHLDRPTEGSLGDPNTEVLAIAKASELQRLGKCEHFVGENGDEVFIESYTSPPALILMGGGHISKSIAPLAKTLGIRILVLDDRPEFSNKDRFPEADLTVVDSYANGLGAFRINPNTAIVIATRGHNFDDIALEKAALTNAGYVGLVGSQRKVILIYEELLKRGLSPSKLATIHAPIGLNIKARTPAEIAISIMAEIVQWRLGGDGEPMKLPEKLLQRIITKLEKAKAKLGVPGN
ncbi:MAG: xanthine dehydrogenase accessory factor [Chloroflexi bacterium]|jgi:xanthine dehydrogenase accessory factor|nr:MAG: xanthine dehydrogenase accessory factor [Chloroflexota bacterium]